MDLTESIAPRSDQINADDLIGGPATYTIREVINGKAEQPFDFLLIETDRAYRPSKTMRRVIVAAWGPQTSAYAGRRLTLYREPSIKFGGQTVGGIRISQMSHINGKCEVWAQTTRGKRERFTVEPLPDSAPATRDYPAEVDSATTVDECSALWRHAGETGDLTDELKAAITAKVEQLKPTQDPPADEQALWEGEGK